MPLLVMALAFLLLFVTLHLAAMRNEILRRRVRIDAHHAGATRMIMSLGPHAAFIVRPMSAAIVISAALIGWIALDYRAQHRILADLDKRGVKRRSRKQAMSRRAPSAASAAARFSRAWPACFSSGSAAAIRPASRRR